jgi:hypothetical protein
MLYRTAILGILFSAVCLAAVQVQLELRDQPVATVRHHATHHRRGCSVPQLGLLTATDVITVSPITDPASVAKFIKLSLDEHVHSIDGLVVEGATAADVTQRVLTAAAALSPQHQVMTLVVDSGDRERRIVVEQSYSGLPAFLQESVIR